MSRYICVRFLLTICLDRSTPLLSLTIFKCSGVTATKPGSCCSPLLGVAPTLVDDEGEVMEGNGVEGNLCFAAPWPSMQLTVYGDHERFEDTVRRVCSVEYAPSSCSLVAGRDCCTLRSDVLLCRLLTCCPPFFPPRSPFIFPLPPFAPNVYCTTVLL